MVEARSFLEFTKKCLVTIKDPEAFINSFYMDELITNGNKSSFGPCGTIELVASLFLSLYKPKYKEYFQSAYRKVFQGNFSPSEYQHAVQEIIEHINVLPYREYSEVVKYISSNCYWIENVYSMNGGIGNVLVIRNNETGIFNPSSIAALFHLFSIYGLEDATIQDEIGNVVGKLDFTDPIKGRNAVADIITTHNNRVFIEKGISKIGVSYQRKSFLLIYHASGSRSILTDLSSISSWGIFQAKTATMG